MCTHILRTRLNAEEFDGWPRYEKWNLCGEILTVRWGKVIDGKIECDTCGKNVKLINAVCHSNTPLQNLCEPPRYWGNQYTCKPCWMKMLARQSFPNADVKVTV